MQIFVGIDWGQEAHQVCAQDDTGEVIFEMRVEHKPAAVFGLIDKLIEQAGGDPRSVLVAIETPHGLLVESMVERELRVFSINPKQLDRFRDRFTPAGAKDDRRDALVLADSLRTDRRAFGEIKLPPAAEIELRTHSRFRTTLSEQIVEVTNRLDAQLRRYYPQVLELGKANEGWILDVLELAPTPHKGQGLRLVQLRRVLERNRIRRITAEKAREILRQANFSTTAGTIEAAGAEVRYLVEQLRLLEAQQKHCTKEIERISRRCAEQQRAQLQTASDSEQESQRPQRTHGDIEIIDSLPGAGSFVTAVMQSEAGAVLRNRDLTTLRAVCGSAPVTRRTGKLTPSVTMRRACNRQLRNACYFMAKAAVRIDPLCCEQYQRLRAARASEGRALRSVADRLLRILVGALRSGSRYDITRLRPSLAEAA